MTSQLRRIHRPTPDAPTAGSRPTPSPTGAFPFPATVQHLDLDGEVVAYLDEGTGPPLLMVHVGLWSFVFRDVIAQLRTDFRCVTVDLPGYGLAPDPTDRRSLEFDELSDLLGRFVDALDLRNTVLVAHDLGGPVALAMAGLRPDRFSGLVLANTFLWEPDTLALRAMFRLVGGRTMTALGTATNLVPRLTSGRNGVGRHLDPGARRAFLAPYAARARRRRFHTTMRSARQHPEVARAAERAATGVFVDVPVLTIFGARNDPFGFQDRHAATFTDHEGLVLDGGNHFPMMDDPELFATTLGDWHRRKLGAGGGR